MSSLLHSWLFAWLFALSISLGALANLMVHALTGGRWGETMRAPLLAAARLLPVLALLFVPILAGVAYIYPWVDHPGRYLNVPLFAARSVAYLAIWILLARSFESRPAVGLVVYAFTMSFAAFDWIASLTPEWRSSGFGLLVVAGQMLAGAAFGVAAAMGNWVPAGAGTTSRPGRRDRGDGPGPNLDYQTRIDLGNLLLMYVLLWAYLAYTQFLITWSENLPHEIAWYLPRMQTGWAMLGLILVVFHFFLPLLILLSRAAKRSPRILGALAVMLLAGRLVDSLWMVMPSVRPQGFAIGWGDVPVTIAMVAICGVLWRRGMRAVPRARQPIEVTDA